jgi:hypothetical protein
MNPADRPPEPLPQNEFERLLVKMKSDPTVHGAALRALMKLELHALAAGHPELVGEHELTAQSVPQFFNFTVDDKGPFVAVFSSEAVVDWILPQIPLKVPAGVVTMEAQALFSLLNDGRRTVRVNFGCGLSLTLKPEAIRDLVSGELTHSRPNPGGEKTQLFPVELDSLPPKLLATVRKFCDQRRVPIAVYALVPAKPEANEPDLTQLRFVLWLRSLDNDFFNDFGLMVGRLMPEGIGSAVGVVTEGDEAGMAFLQRCTPLWPVTE